MMVTLRVRRPVSPQNVKGSNMIIVTGGAGMIGSNIVKTLNDRGHTDILVVDNLKDGTKFVNLADLDITDYMDKEEFLTYIMSGEDLGPIEAVFHEGACSATTEWDGKYMMDNNYQYSKDLLHFCLEREIPSCMPLRQPPMVDAMRISSKSVSTSSR